MLLGSLPLGRSVQLGGGPWVHLSPESLEEWASGRCSVPVLEEHDVNKLVGWCDKVVFNRHQQKALLFGATRGRAGCRSCRPARAGACDGGLSPSIVAHPGRVWLQQRGGGATATSSRLPELSVCQWPQNPDARWLGV